MDQKGERFGVVRRLFLKSRGGMTVMYMCRASGYKEKGIYSLTPSDCNGKYGVWGRRRCVGVGE